MDTWRLAAGDYSLKEAHNQQQSRNVAQHRSLCPRIEVIRDECHWGQHYDYGATLRAEEAPGGAVRVHADAWLCDSNHVRLPDGGPCTLDYELDADGLHIAGSVPVALAAEARYILPIVADAAEVMVETGATEGDPERIFNLCPGFEARDFRIRLAPDGRFAIRITL